MRASHFVYIVVAFTTFAATDLLFNRDNALAAFNQATQLNPKMAKAYVVRGDISRLTPFVKKILYRQVCSGEGRKIWQNRMSSWSHLAP
jgi:hypothetical protein